MPIVSGNQQEPSKKSSGSWFGWIVFLLVFGRPIYNIVRSMTSGLISDQQLLILGGGLMALVALAVIIQRVNRVRDSGASPISPAHVPRSDPSASLKQYTGRSMSGDRSLPTAPRFEPIITGNVILVGLLLALLLAGVGLLILFNVPTI